MRLYWIQGLYADMDSLTQNSMNRFRGAITGRPKLESSPVYPCINRLAGHDAADNSPSVYQTALGDGFIGMDSPGPNAELAFC